ncbi:MAG: ABC transporter permease [Candidatus Korarchaeota archaeon]|nr:ABC transporter permease [Candidatus Korarchaeota archaeon]
MIEAKLIENILWIGLRSATPLLLAALGEIYAERSGILNLGVEGMMAVGALSSFATALVTGNPWLGVLVGMLSGGSLSMIHGAISIGLKGNQVVSGLALTMFGLGLSSVLGRVYVGNQLPVEARFLPKPVEPLSSIPVLGKVLFDQDPLFYVSLLLALIMWLLLYRTKYGIVIRSTGENPAAVDAMGIDVNRVRYLSTLIGGIFAGLAGAYLSVAYNPAWIENMTAGRGWIALALVIFSLWDPLRALLGSYLFGIVEASGYTLQAYGYSQWLLNGLPYLLTVVILTLGATESMRRRMGAPAALGKPYEREER